MSDLDDLWRRIETIEERNRKVEADKAWEMSFFRVLSIAAMTYVTASLFLLLAHLPHPFLNALIPTIGYALSMQSLPLLRTRWMRKLLEKTKENSGGMLQ